MSGQFEKFHEPTPSSGDLPDLFGKNDGVSPEEAGRQDARAAMAEARAILQAAAKRLLLKDLCA